MMRMMRSINVPGAVVGYSGVVSCRLLCTYSWSETIERENKHDLEDNKQFSDAKLDAQGAAGLVRSEREDLENIKRFSDFFRIDLDPKYASFAAHFVRSQGDRKLPDPSDRNSENYNHPRLDVEGPAHAAGLYAELEVLQKLYHQNPMDVQILRKLAETMTRLATIPILPVEYEQREEWYRESKSLLEKALDINKNDDNVKFELGRAHYYIVSSDRTVKWGSDSYVEHVISAYRYFKEVKNKGPEVYKLPMLDVLRRFVWPFMSDLESISRNWKSASSELHQDNTEQNKKEYGDPSNTPSTGHNIGRFE